uniref:Calmodulin-lysine N-methyltransferase n=1 Tax=Opuntia streptacantha TaxID=393608 RepID=A0A7C8YHS8_OPUST
MVRVREIQVGPTQEETLLIHELDDLCDSFTGRAMTGSWIWDSALLLSHFISTQFHLRAKTVLELGAGTGLPGLTASRHVADRVILTDVGALLPGLRTNVEANGMCGRVEACELVWGSDEFPSRLTELIGESGVDLVLMSDVLYDPSLMEAMAKTLKMVCGRKTKIWAATEVRDSAMECLSELASHGFESTELASRPLSQIRGGSNCEDVFAVYLITPPNPKQTQ